MDGSRFDQLTRSLAGSSRRSLLSAALGGALAAVGLADAADAARKRRAGEVCRKNGDCASNVCGPKDSHGRRRCSCLTANDCTAPGQCQVAACTNGVCGGAEPTNSITCTLAGGGTGYCVGGSCVDVAGSCKGFGTCTPADGCGGGTCGGGVSTCYGTAEGLPACVDTSGSCSPTCTTSADCAAGTVCITTTCCGSVCDPLCGSGVITTTSVEGAHSPQNAPAN